jgi:nucleotide-binding universal stress UspA family protein
MSAPKSAPVSGPVVVGFDAQSTGADALAFARTYSQVVGAPLIVTVVHPAPAAISPGRVDAEWVADRHRAAETILTQARELCGGDGSPVEYRVVASSSAAHGLHDLAEDVGAGLIVVGSRSEASTERMFAGSTAERLLSGSVCPVAVAPPGLRDRPPTSGFARIGVAYIEEPEAVAALMAGAVLARAVAARGGAAELSLYTVVAAEADALRFGLGRDAERAFVATARESYQAALDAAITRLPSGVRGRGHVLTGDVVEVLADLDNDAVDLLFCGSRGYGPVRRVLLGGVSSRLVRRARSPVVVVPRES